MGGGEEGGRVGGGTTNLFGKFDEVVGDGDLGADVAELGEGAEEEVFSVSGISRGVGKGGKGGGGGEGEMHCFQKEPGAISPISCSITAMSASVTSGMGAKKKINCGWVSHIALRGERRTYSKEYNETGYAKVKPLYLLQSIGRVTDVLEEDIGCQQRSGHRAYSLNGLCQIKANL